MKAWLICGVLLLGGLIASVAHADIELQGSPAVQRADKEYQQARSALHTELIGQFQHARDVYARAHAARLLGQYRVESSISLLVDGIDFETAELPHVERSRHADAWSAPSRWPAVDALADMQLSAVRPILGAIQRDLPMQHRRLLILALRRIAGSEVAVALLAQEAGTENDRTQRARLEDAIRDVRRQQADRWPVPEPYTPRFIADRRGRDEVNGREPTGTQREFDAAAAQDFESSRSSALMQLVRRPGMRPSDQAYLVHIIYTRMDFESSKVALLMALIQSHDFADAGKAAILKELKDHMSFESSRQHILSAINQRGELPW